MANAVAVSTELADLPDARHASKFDLAAAAVSAEDVALLREIGCFCGC